MHVDNCERWDHEGEFVDKYCKYNGDGRFSDVFTLMKNAKDKFPLLISAADCSLSFYSWSTRVICFEAVILSPQMSEMLTDEYTKQYIADRTTDLGALQFKTVAELYSSIYTIWCTENIF